MVKRIKVKKVKKNIKYIQLILFTLLNLFIFSNFSYSQAISLSTSKSIITLQETFSVQILFSKDNKREFKAFRKFIFPDIADFEKGRTEFLDKNEDKEEPKEEIPPEVKPKPVFKPIIKPVIPKREEGGEEKKEE